MAGSADALETAVEYQAPQRRRLLAVGVVQLVQSIASLYLPTLNADILRRALGTVGLTISRIVPLFRLSHIRIRPEALHGTAASARMNATAVLRRGSPPE